VDGGLKLARIEGSSNQLTVTEVVDIAKKYKADITPGRQIRWVDSTGETPSWIETLQFRPSVLDSLILERAWKVGPSYLTAAQAATGWNRRTLFGFLQIMLVGRPIETAEMNRSSFNYWKGIIIGVMVYGKLRRH
tara:strand:+ start:35107 stop:35511 length:405 start_codon:yes stop_codon:yes gene_type:complete